MKKTKNLIQFNSVLYQSFSLLLLGLSLIFTADVKAQNVSIDIGENTEYAKFELVNPKRLVVDVMSKLDEDRIRIARPTEHEVYNSPEMTRLIYNLSEVSKYSLERRGSRLLISMGSDAAKVNVNESAENLTELKEIKLSIKDKRLLLELGKLNAGPEFIKSVEDKGLAIFRLRADSYKAGIFKKIAPSDYNSNLLSAQVYKKSDGAVLLALELQSKQDLNFRRNSKGNYELSFLNSSELMTSQSNFSASVLYLNGKSLPKDNKFKGQRISLEFKEIDIHDLLRMISDVSKMNIIASDDVTGRVTIRLEDVPWDHALDIILRSRSLGMQKLDNIIRVAPLSVLQAEREEMLKKEEAEKKLAPLIVRLIPISYSQVIDMIPQVEGILSERGKVSSDKRTNTLIVEDVPNKIEKIVEMVRIMDAPTPQVLIEARIVEMRKSLKREVGVQWGGNMLLDQAHGSSTGMIFPNSVGLAGVASGTQNLSSISSLGSGPSNFAVNIPVTTPTGGIGLTLGSVTKGLNLNLFLSAMEDEGTIDIVSAPKILVLDNKEAIIRQGLSIPTKTISAEGTQVKYVDALLELKVTPHVVSDGSVFLNLEINKDEPDPSLNVDKQPAIFKKQTTTELLVRNGDTKVIGGIYFRQKSVSKKKVPFFGDLPLVGVLFRGTNNDTTKTELMIFITPKVVKNSSKKASLIGK